ncbi:hypothetical protein R3P38DRAFT_3195820 [Favolaschia claudopus]|uniref:Uncharacterized protein n=1 Tax=Favolaschia claudopus TaxID=2862362 RepID=A0AAW0B8T4_9AGAR
MLAFTLSQYSSLFRLLRSPAVAHAPALRLDVNTSDISSRRLTLRNDLPVGNGCARGTDECVCLMRREFGRHRRRQQAAALRRSHRAHRAGMCFFFVFISLSSSCRCAAPSNNATIVLPSLCPRDTSALASSSRRVVSLFSIFFCLLCVSAFRLSLRPPPHSGFPSNHHPITLGVDDGAPSGSVDTFSRVHDGDHDVHVETRLTVNGAGCGKEDGAELASRLCPPPYTGTRARTALRRTQSALASSSGIP